MKQRLAIITTHPIQYNAPLFKCLAERSIIEIMVFYTWGESVLHNKYDPGFGMIVNWDVPLLQGYDFKFLENISKKPGSDHFSGIDNPGIIKEIDAWRPDAIMVYGWNFKSHLKLMAHYKGKTPVFFRGDSTCLDDRGLFMPAMRRLWLWAVYSYVDKAFYPGSNNKTYLRKAFMSEKKLVFAPHTVDNDFFRDPDGVYERKAAQWRQELGIGGRAIVFLFAGKLEKKKSPFLLLDAFNAGHFPEDTHLIFAGNGELENSLKKNVTDKRIHFIGFQNQSAMPAIYRLGDVFVLPSGGPGETWGLSINEAMACARPVLVSTKCGGGVDLVQEGVNGYLFESGNQEQLKNKMGIFLQDRAKLKQMGAASLEHIRQYSVSKVAEAIEQTLIVRP
jgi:glycosyltransferase involved in cell wall biosynthesis